MMKLKHIIHITLITMLLSCSADKSVETELSVATKTKEIQGNLNHSESLEFDANYATKMLDKAKQSLKTVPQEFQWRDTHLIIAKAQELLKKGEYELSVEQAQIVIQQSKLMSEQKDFAKDNWQNLMPKIEE